MKAMGAVVVSGLLLAAGTAVADDASLSAQELQGKHLYDRTCIYCHGSGLWGANRLAKRIDKEHALLESRTELSAVAIRAIVRTGIGSMTAPFPQAGNLHIPPQEVHANRVPARVLESRP